VRAGLNTILISILLTPVLFTSAEAETVFVRPGKYLVEYKTDRPKKTSGKKIPIISINGESKRKRPKRYHRFYNKCARLKKANPEIKDCTPDYIIKTQDADPFLFTCTAPSNCLWPADNIKNSDIDLPLAWQLTLGTPDIVVAVLDTGLDLAHPDIAANIWTNPNEIPGNGLDDDNNGYIDDIHGINTTGSGTSIQDDNGHGTHVSGIIAAIKDNGIGIAGTAPNVKILPVKILDATGTGSIESAVNGINYIVDLAVNHHIPIFVFNNSWGGAITDATVLRNAFENANQAQILAAAAAGNGGSDGIGDNLDSSTFIPAELDVNNIISVASYDFSGRLSSFSNFGINSVDIAAPGGSIRSLLAGGVTFGNATSVENGTVIASGTSMATPYVTGVLALMRAYLPSLNYLKIKDRLLQRTYPLAPEDASKILSGGRLNAYYALTDDSVEIPTPLPSFTATETPIVLNTPTAVFTATITPQVSFTPAAFTPLPEATIFIAEPESQAEVNIYPLSFIRSQVVENFIDAKKSNILSIDVRNAKDSDLYTLTLSNGACFLKEISLSQVKSTSLLRLQKSARKIKNIKFFLKSASGKVLFDGSFPVKAGPKGQIKVSCKILRKNVILTGEG
jgi:subtilisin family serine protease